MAIVRGTFRADTLVGTDAEDGLYGLGGDDVLSGGLGDDLINGGFGVDTAVLRGSVLETTISRSGLVQMPYVVTSGPDGTDGLFLVERIQFDDFLYNLVGNNVPFLRPDTATTREDRAVQIPIATLLSNDREFDGDPLLFQGVDASGTTGSVTVVDGKVVYDPVGRFDGLSQGESATDSFAYTVSDGRGGLASTTVTVTIEGRGGQAVDVLGTDGSQDSNTSVYTHLNEGTGAFGPGVPNDWEDTQTEFLTTFDTLALGDMDGDGDLDAAAGGFGLTAGSYNYLFTNDGTGTFFGRILPGETSGVPGDPANPEGTPPCTRDVALGDLDGDGDLDIVFSNRVNTEPGLFDYPGDQILFNDGAGNFIVNEFRGKQFSDAVALGDLDGDRDLDMVISDTDEGPLVAINDGTGAFTTRAVAGALGGASALGDLDGDGDLDAIGNSQLWINDGSANFTVSPSPLPGASALADFDADGDLDALRIHEGASLWRNDGSAGFTLAWADSSVETNTVDPQGAVGDVDGDGDIDAVVGEPESGAAGRDWVLRNDGTGTFAVELQPVDAQFYAAVVGDLDGTPALTPAGLPDLGPLVPVPADPAVA